MEDGKILGIDYGEAKIGLAISFGEIAKPLVTVKIDSGNPRDSRNQIVRICRKEDVGKIVVGISEGAMAEKTQKFGQELKEATSLSVEYWNETLTSQEAVRKMVEAGKKKSRRRLDEHSFAACLILQDFLDSH